MPHRIEIGLRDGVIDPRGISVRERIRSELNIPVDDVRTVNIFTLNFDLEEEQLNFIAKELFRDNVIETYSVNSPIASGFDYLIEKSFRPGVTDNVGKTAKKNIEFWLDKKLDRRAPARAQFVERVHVGYLVLGRTQFLGDTLLATKVFLLCPPVTLCCV